MLILFLLGYIRAACWGNYMLMNTQCNFCRNGVKTKKYKNVTPDAQVVWCCTWCRDNLDLYPSDSVAQSLSSRMGSYLSGVFKRDLYRKDASLLDLCCDAIVDDTFALDALLENIDSCQMHIVRSLKRALVSKNLTRLNCKTFERIDRKLAIPPTDHIFVYSRAIGGSKQFVMWARKDLDKNDVHDDGDVDVDVDEYDVFSTLWDDDMCLVEK